ncbi:Vacuolar protein-sorting-associated protein 33 [Malassezia cuniculi]|uniref:Vacuolar protein-sorting-associated protein 33 n=1 Tax=Malassezia cuniculi TaxID=948313 RepID=A0AAF0J7C0_9BASI|nr:Vacuolar protein-sorting-associated protein 33 [Malassezia cuniculi]
MSAPPALDTQAFAQLAHDGFAQTLEAIPHSKTLLIDPALAGPLGLVSDSASLRQHGVDKMFWLEDAGARSVAAPTQHIVYLCRPHIKWMRTIETHIRSDEASGAIDHSYSIAFVPHRTEPCLHYLRTHDILRHVSILDYGLEFSVLRHDLLSLDDEDAWARPVLYGDQTSVFHAAQALMTMQRMYGAFPRILGKGDLAIRVCDLLVRQRREHLAAGEDPALSTHSAKIDALVIIDRAVDLVTPLSLQLTYQGLIDEVVGIKHGFVEVDSSWIDAQKGGSSAKRRYRLDGGNDELFDTIRDANFAAVGEKLHHTARTISKDYEGRHSAQTVGEIRAFVGQLGGLQSRHASLRLHTFLTERLLAESTTERFSHALEIQQNIVAGIQPTQQLQAIEELMLTEAPPLLVLRLACLASIVSGLKAKWLDTFRREFVQTYGFRHFGLLMALEKTGILVATQKTRASRLGDVRRSLQLLDDTVDERNPTNISYVFSGYAPLSVRLVQTMCQRESLSKKNKTRAIDGWDGADEAVVNLPGATFDVPQEATRTPLDDAPTTVVFFFGGVTYAELAALRLLSRQGPRRYLVATTSLVSGNTLLSQLGEPIV